MQDSKMKKSFYYESDASMQRICEIEYIKLLYNNLKTIN
jgi:hypothetical protein